MKRSKVLTLAAVTLIAAVTAIPAEAVHSSSSTNKMVYHNWQCGKALNRYDPGTWACTTIIVQPFTVAAGSSTTVTFRLRARTTFRYLLACFSRINSRSCAFQHRYSKMQKGRTMVRSITMNAPAVSRTGLYSVENLSRFYKRQKGVVLGPAYWSANARVCILSSAQDTSCSGGR